MLRKFMLFSFVLLLILADIHYSQWTKSGGPAGGLLYSVAVSENFIFAGYYAGGIYRSSDDGASWTQLTSLPDSYVKSVYISGSVIYAGIAGRVYTSSDDGNTWSLRNNGLPENLGIINGFAETGQYLFAASDKGIFCTADQGLNWTAVNSGLTNLEVNTIAVKGSDLFACISYGGIFKSTDLGQSWSAINTGLFSINYTTLCVADNKLFAGGDELYVSENDGSVWQNIQIPMQQVNCIRSNGTTLYIGGRSESGNVLFQSSNNGGDWTDISNGINASEIQTIEFKGALILAGSYYSGIFKTADYNSGWTKCDKGILASWVQAIAVDGSKVYCGTRGGGVFKTTDNGLNWLEKNNGLTCTRVEELVINGTKIYAGTEKGLYLTENEGELWSSVLADKWITALAVSENAVIAGSNGSIYYSHDNGVSWSAGSGVPDQTQINCMKINGHYVYAGTSAGVLLSENNGVSWSDISSNLPDTHIRAIEFLDSNIIVGTNGNGVWMSADKGVSWTHLSQTYPISYCEALAVKGKNIFAASVTQIYHSTDAGKSWEFVTPYMPTVIINNVAYNDSYLFAALHGNSIWTRPLSQLARYTVTADINIAAGGTVNGQGVYLHGSTVSMLAVPDTDYHFVNWTEEDLILSSEQSYEFVVTNDKTLKANFEIVPRLVVDPVFIEVDPDSGEGLLQIKNVTGGIMHWNAVSNSDWITIAGSDTGTNNGILNYTYSGNSSVLRKGSITVNAPGANGNPVIIEINQAAMLDTLTILHVNDTHSMLAPAAPRGADLKGTRGGIARAASVIGLTKASEPNVLTLHCGDAFIGDLFFNKYFGAAEFQLMKALGFDAMTPGNHEFDLGPALLQTVLDSSLAGNGFDVISSNLILEDVSLEGLRKYIKPYTIKKFGNIKAGIFALTTPSANYFSQPSPAVIDTNIQECITNSLGALSAEGCNIIICLSHLGINYDKMIAASVPGINIIVSAHDHIKTEVPLEIINPSGTTTYLVQANAFYSHVGRMKVIINPYGVNLLTYQLIALDENIPEEPQTAAIVDELISGIETVYGPMYTQQVGYAEAYFEEVADSFFVSGPHSTPVGNLVTDAFRTKTGTDIAITVGGSTAQPLYEGPVVAADIYRMIGYGMNETDGLGYRLVKFNISAPYLWGALEGCLSMSILDDELFPQVSGMSFGYEYTETGLKLLDVNINGVSLDPASDKVYSVTTNEFIAYALQSVFGISVSDSYTYQDVTEFSAVLEYIISQGGKITPDYEPRITPVNESPAAPREFRLEQNYPNPFNPSTTIRFSVPSAGRVVLKIYNTVGQEVSTIVNEELNSGTYEYIWSPKNLSSGIYFYSLHFKDKIYSRKMLLMK